MKYLLDTNVLSEPVKPRPNERVLKRLERHRREFGWASPVLHEIKYGIERLEKSSRKLALSDYLQRLLETMPQALPYGPNAATWHAVERARLEREGISTSFVDGQIAAIAATNQLVLVTRNVEHYAMFSGLKFENWFH